ncbi:MAG: transcriptional activator NhaR [Planctomycetota bacterium]
MDWINYHHLLYFWTVASEGSVTAACERLHLAQPTISSQLKKFERAIGNRLFERSGRNLVLTDTGRLVFDYADQIFSLGRELSEVLAGRQPNRPLRFAVGVPDVLPKLITFRILRPVLSMPEPVQLVCVEGSLENLLLDMAAHRLDLVLSDTAANPSSNIRVFNHLLGECGISVFGSPQKARALAKGFPGSLNGERVLLPTRNTLLRRSLDQWFDAASVRPSVVAEFQDTALTKIYGQVGLGLFFAPSAIEEEICRQFHVAVVGRLEGVRESFYAVSPERRIKHPAVGQILRAARQELFEQRA